MPNQVKQLDGYGRKEKKECNEKQACIETEEKRDKNR